MSAILLSIKSKTFFLCVTFCFCILLQTSSVLLATGSLIYTIISIAYRAFRANVKDIQIFCPDVYDFIREGFRKVWRWVYKLFCKRVIRGENEALNDSYISFSSNFFLILYLYSYSFFTILLEAQFMLDLIREWFRKLWVRKQFCKHRIQGDNDPLNDTYISFSSAFVVAIILWSYI